MFTFNLNNVMIFKIIILQILFQILKKKKDNKQYFLVKDYDLRQ